MIEQHLVAASSYARDIDDLIVLITVLVGFWFLLCEGIFFGLIWAFRAKRGRRAQFITGEEPHQKRWVAWPHYLVLVCDIFIIAGAVRVWYDVKQDLPPADRTVRIVGQQWAWSFVHPGADGVLDTADDIKTVDELHLEVGKTYHYKLEARDVLHNFSVPVFRLKQDAIPGRVITGWFRPTVESGRERPFFDVQCAEICGIGHGVMVAKVFISSAEAHAAWIARNSPVEPVHIASVGPEAAAAAP